MLLVLVAQILQAKHILNIAILLQAHTITTTTTTITTTTAKFYNLLLLLLLLLPLLPLLLPLLSLTTRCYCLLLVGQSYYVLQCDTTVLIGVAALYYVVLCFTMV